MKTHANIYCQHNREAQLFAEVEPGHIRCTHYRCTTCGRVRANPFHPRQRNRVHPLTIIIPVALACLLIAYWWLINFQ